MKQPMAKQHDDTSFNSKLVMGQYRELVNEIDIEVLRLREAQGRSLCPANCFECCRNTATMLISEVEGQDVKEGLKTLPQEIQAHILKKLSSWVILMNRSRRTLG